jgi:micrococcal nuclease
VQQRRRFVPAVSGCLLLLGACRLGGPPSSAASAAVTSAPAGSNAVMARDVDGDTIDVTINGKSERVRLIGVDTPETKKPNTPVQCYGELASGHTKSLLAVGTALRLERDVVPRDDYGRLLAYVYRAKDGLFVNLDLVVGGYAKVLTIPPNTAHRVEFVDAATRAEAGDVGLWGACR